MKTAAAAAAATTTATATAKAPEAKAPEPAATGAPGEAGTTVRAALRELFSKNANDGAGDGAADEATGSNDPADGGPETGENAVPKTLKDLAERLGCELDQLYEIEYRDGTDGKGKARKLGELKDAAAKADELDARELAWEEKRVKAENDLLRSRQEVAFILDNLPKSAVTPEIQRRAAAERERVAKVERAKTLEAIPEWSDADLEESDRDGIAEFMEGYGYHVADIDRVIDHRMLKLLRDAWQRERRINAVLAQVEERKPAGAKPAAGTPNAAGKKFATIGNKASARRDLRRKLGETLRGKQS